MAHDTYLHSLNLAYLESLSDGGPAVSGDAPLKTPQRSLNPLQLGNVDDFAHSYALENYYTLEHAYIQDPLKKAWLAQNKAIPISDQDYQKAFQDIIKSELFENFLHTKFQGAKRFSLEGLQSLIAGLNSLITQGMSHYDQRHYVLGMSHRGRLNVMCHCMDHDLILMMAKFQGTSHNVGDVKYHQGFTQEFNTPHQPERIVLLPNPSHLESIGPVVMGYVKQHPSAWGIIIHGDAAFAAQGIVYESLQLSRLQGYKTNGLIHIVLDNQIGFTTPENQARSTADVTAIATLFDMPIFHVNSHDVNGVLHAFRDALAYKAAFSQDVLIHVVGYRRYGHNEGDDPTLTQPLMYEKIHQMPPISAYFGAWLKKHQINPVSDQQNIRESYGAVLRTAYETSLIPPAPLTTDDSEDTPPPYIHRSHHGACINALQQAIVPPPGFNCHKTVLRFIDQRLRMLSGDIAFDWSCGEMLAIATLLLQNISVRLSGQDTVRGTFSQRHGVFVDQQNEETYTPLSHLATPQGTWDIINSPLSEVAALAFDYGHSIQGTQSSGHLTLWEAQFGDFANGAQVIIDQYMAAGHTKWGQKSNLVLLLPHGYEGQGPEHSSARLERFLQLSADHNWRVMQCTTPANYFHSLVSQCFVNQGDVHDHGRSDTSPLARTSPLVRPLIMMTPKSLLRHKMAVSSLADIGPGTTLQKVISDPVLSTPIKRHVFCSGKIYYHVKEAMLPIATPEIALHRIEQLYPFPTAEISKILQHNKAEVVWCQEEPRNMGAYHFIQPYFNDLGITIGYVGRPAAASPATGSYDVHQQEQKAIIETVLSLGVD